MEKIIRRNVWGALKRSGPGDWPMGARPAERRANFFLMNSAACSTMQSDCQRLNLTYGPRLEGPNDRTNSAWRERKKRGGGGVGQRLLLLAPPLFF